MDAHMAELFIPRTIAQTTEDPTPDLRGIPEGQRGRESWQDVMDPTNIDSDDDQTDVGELLRAQDKKYREALADLQLKRHKSPNNVKDTIVIPPEHVLPVEVLEIATKQQQRRHTEDVDHMYAMRSSLLLGAAGVGAALLQTTGKKLQDGSLWAAIGKYTGRSARMDGLDATNTELSRIAQKMRESLKMEDMEDDVTSINIQSVLKAIQSTVAKNCKTHTSAYNELINIADKLKLQLGFQGIKNFPEETNTYALQLPLALFNYISEDIESKRQRDVDREERQKEDDEKFTTRSEVYEGRMRALESQRIADEEASSAKIKRMRDQNEAAEKAAAATALQRLTEMETKYNLMLIEFNAIKAYLDKMETRR
jgi:hypothetical protein